MALLVLPEAETIVRSYLASTAEVTAIVPANRIQVSRTLEGVTWPAIRITNVAAFLVTPEVVNSADVQIDCFGTSDAQASLLARTVLAALVAMRDENYVALGGEVVGVDFVLGPTSLPDDSRQPVVDRWLIRASVHVSPAP